ncbi:MAG: rod-binding protein [Holosporales bacterium]|jgi:flagellar protein FlgJ
MKTSFSPSELAGFEKQLVAAVARPTPTGVSEKISARSAFSALMDVTPPLPQRQQDTTQKGAALEVVRKAEQKAKEFEALTIGQLLQPMFEGLQPDSLFGGGHGEEHFRSFLLQEYGKLFADRGGIGLARPIKENLLRSMEV